MKLILSFSTVKMDEREFRILTKHCFLTGKNTVEAKAWFDKCYGDSAPSKETIERWYAELKNSRTNTGGAKRSK